MAINDTAVSLNTTDDRWLRLAHTLWYPAAAIALGIVIASMPGYILMLREGGPGFDLVADPSSLKIALNIAFVVISISAALLSLTLSWVLYRKKSSERMVVFLSFFLLLFGVGVGPLETLAQMWVEYPAFGSPILVSVLLAPPFIALMFLFPDGRFVPSWTRWMVIFSIPIILIGFILEASIESSLSSPMGIGSLWSFAVGLTALVAQVYRYRVVSGPDERQQTKWVVYGLSLMFIFMGVSAVPYGRILLLTPGSPFPWWVSFTVLLYAVSLTFLPLSLTVAVLRYRLYEIDIIINRSLVYGVLTAIIVGFYVLVVGAVSVGFQTNIKFTGALFATILVGILFKPLRAILQRAVDRMMYPKGGGIHHHVSMKRLDDLMTHEEVTKSASLTGGWVRITRLAWYLAASAALGILVASIPGYYRVLQTGIFANFLVEAPTILSRGLNLAYVVLSISAALISFALAWILFSRKPSERMAVFLSFYLLAYGVWFAGPLWIIASFWPELALKIFLVISGLIGPSTVILFFTFPDGKFVPSWTRWLVLGSIPIIPLSYTFGIPLSIPSQSYIDWLVWILGLGLFLGALYAQFYRYRKVSNFIERQQTKWVVYGFAVWFLILSVAGFFYARMEMFTSGSLSTLWIQVNGLMWVISIMIFPVSLAIAVMRYRLYDIDIIINRTLVYGVLTASTMGIYVIVVGYLGNVFRSQDKSIIAFLTTGLVALLFQPLRERLQRVVNRLMYGERDDPVAILTILSKRLETTIVPEAVLPGLVETVAQALKLPYVAIETHNREPGTILAAFGEPQEEIERFPLIHQSEIIGKLVIACRAPGESFSQSERELLRNIARQAGVAVHTIQLTTDLRFSRQRLVTTREEERRRLRRDLHDGLGASLAALHLEMGALRRMIRGNPEKAEVMVDETRTRLREGINDIRRVVYQLRPPALDELGLVAALRAQAERFNEKMELDPNPGGDPSMAETLEIKVEAPENLPPLPAAIEVAAYRIVQEALTNVVQHSKASTCFVQLALEDELNLKISDDGIGIGDVQKTGIGLHSMQERAEELGGRFAILPGPQGGTLVWVRLPILQE
jgi:signal transduction histidine kinase